MARSARGRGLPARSPHAILLNAGDAEGRSRADLDAIMSGYVGRVRPLAVP